MILSIGMVLSMSFIIPLALTKLTMLMFQLFLFTISYFLYSFAQVNFILIPNRILFFFQCILRRNYQIFSMLYLVILNVSNRDLKIIVFFYNDFKWNRIKITVFQLKNSKFAFALHLKCEVVREESLLAPSQSPS